MSWRRPHAYATLAWVRHPAMGRLNSGVMRGLAAGCAGSLLLSLHQSSRSSAAKHSPHCQFHVRAARLPARQRSKQLFAPEISRLMWPFAPVSPRTGQAALLASVASHGRKPFSPQTGFTGSLLPAPTNPRDIAASPGFGWSHNSSFKPTPCRGVGHVLYATLARVRRPATGRLNSGVRPHRRGSCKGKI